MPIDLNLAILVSEELKECSLETAVKIRKKKLYSHNSGNCLGIITTLYFAGDSPDIDDIKVLEKKFNKSGKYVYKYTKIQKLSFPFYLLITQSKYILPIVEKDWEYIMYLNSKEYNLIKGMILDGNNS